MADDPREPGALRSDRAEPDAPSGDRTEPDAGEGEPDGGTRRRILDAATAILVEDGYHRMSLERVATRAGVARATIYYQFGSKSGLTEEVLSDIELRERIHESREQDRTVEDLLRRVTGIWERHRDVLRGIVGMVAADPPTREAIGRHQMGRRQRVTELVDELAGAGKLRAGRADAVDAIWLLTSFSAYDYFRQHGIRTPEEALRLLERLATAVVEPDGRAP